MKQMSVPRDCDACVGVDGNDDIVYTLCKKYSDGINFQVGRAVSFSLFYCFGNCAVSHGLLPSVCPVLVHRDGERKT